MPTNEQVIPEMPGYRLLSTNVSGAVADRARDAEALQASGDLTGAISMLEQALALSVEQNSVLPGWLCGRLAALYRVTKRYEDEVMLLTRYRESQISDEARTRFDARLSKAQAIADRNSSTEVGALASIRAMRERPRRRSKRRSSVESLMIPESSDASAAAPPLSVRVQALLADARDHNEPVEAIVTRLKYVYANADCDPAAPTYADALVTLLSTYFDQAAPGTRDARSA